MGKAAGFWTPARPKRSLPAEMTATSSQVNQGNRSESVWMCVHHMSKWSQHHTNSGVQIASSNVISSVYAAER